jgi:hypothetical protein
MLLTREKSQLLIVDVQDKLLDAMSGKGRLVQRCVRLVQAAKTLDIPITVSEQYPQGLGPTVEALRWRSATAPASEQGRILLRQERGLAQSPG